MRGGDFTAWALVDEFEHVNGLSFAKLSQELTPTTPRHRVDVDIAHQNFVLVSLYIYFSSLHLPTALFLTLL